jgi:hypothetical protein
LTFGDVTYGDFEDELVAIVVGLEGVQNGRQLDSVEFDYTTVSNRLIVPWQASKPN